MDFLHTIAEEKIREAIRRGELDNLPGSGKPLPPDDLENVPKDLRLGFKLLKNAGLIPEEMQLRKDIVTLGDLLAVCRDHAEREKLQRELSAKRLRYQALISAQGWQESQAFSEYEPKIQKKLTEND
ncbi:DnaJ family domain-containing protein [Paenibacillus sp. DYY-L-2]|uniref:DnaJ family domain-containing protein n=1 Tax=Paenibacillus sp. DYY-L-2 TaxID=3447013 RepID=UPI003F4F7246